MKQRDIFIDCIRALGLILIILAHIPNIPILVKSIRRFDVCLMVIISGYLYSQIENSDTKIFEYLYKRIKRLVFPTWIFLIIFFILIIPSIKFLGKYPFNKKIILESFILWRGIGYIWIIRIYLFVALFGPYFYRKMNKNKILMNLIKIYLFYELVVSFYYYSDINSSILEIGIFEIIPYILLFIYGAHFHSIKKIRNFNKKNILYFGICFFIGVLLYIFNRNIFNFLYSKYPPRVFYIAYGIFCFNILFYIKEFFIGLEIKELKMNKKIIKIISFIGSSTMWIYFWHIPIIFIVILIDKKIKINWILWWGIVIFLSCLIIFIQKKIVLYICNKISSNKIKKNIKILFLGLL